MPNAPGGGSDTLTRILTAELTTRLGQPFMVENRAGAGGNIGMTAALKSPPDGYTLAAATVSQWVINPFLYNPMPFDAETEVGWVSLGWEQSNILVVPAAHVPATTTAEFLAWARAQGKPLVFSSPGIGTSGHLLGELLGNRGGFPVTHIPFRGSALAIPAVLRGDVQFTIDNLAAWLPQVQSGAARALAITAAERSALLPAVPTMAEVGLPEFTVSIWGGFVGPAGMPEPAVRAVSQALQAIVRDPAVVARAEAAGATLLASSPEGMRARADKERPFWKELVRLSGAKAD